MINARSAILAKIPANVPVFRIQTPRLPLFSAVAPTVGMPASAVDRTACYEGQTALRIGSITSAREAVADLTPDISAGVQ